MSARFEVSEAPAPVGTEPRLTSLSHGGGCGCKIAPGVLAEILKKSSGFPVPKELLVGIETSDDAAVYRLNDERSRLKKAINLASGSRLVEEKSYSFYHSKGGDHP